VAEIGSPGCSVVTTAPEPPSLSAMTSSPRKALPPTWIVADPSSRKIWKAIDMAFWIGIAYPSPVA
jgi:hypothetical protein